MSTQTAIVVFEGQEARAAPLIRWAMRAAIVDGAALQILSCRESEVPRGPEPATVSAEVEANDAFTEAAREVIAENPEVKVEVWSLESPELGQAIISFLEEHEIRTLIAGADGRVPMDPTAAPLEERLLRFAPCPMIVIDPGDSDGGRCQTVGIGTGGELSDYALRETAEMLPGGAANRLIPFFVGRAFGEDAEAVAKQELAGELKKAGIEAHADIQPAAILADDDNEGILEAASENEVDLIVIGATTTRALRQLREVEKRLGREGSRPAIALVRPAKIRTRGVADFLVRNVLHWIPKLEASERLELFDRLQAGARWDKNFSIMIGLSTAIASVGLIQSSPAVVIGAMLVAPLMSPLIAAGLALVQGNFRLFRSSARAMILGVFAGFLLSVIIGSAAPHDELSQEIMARGAPTILDLLVAFLSGMAAAYVIAQPSLLAAMAGVAIAAALIPPLSSVGLALTSGSWDVAAGAATLLTINLVAIVLGAALVFKAVGVQGSQLGVGRPLWVRRAILTLIILVIGFAWPLAYQLSEKRRTGQDRPLLHPVNPTLDRQITSRVEAEPGVDLFLLGRSHSKWDSIVGVVLVAEGPVRQELIEEIHDLVEDELGDRLKVVVDVLKRGEVLPALE